MSRLAPADHPRVPMRNGLRRDPHARLLHTLLQTAGEGSRIDAASSRPWASATFTGSRHMIDLRFEGAQAHDASATLTERLPEAQFNIPGYIVADVSIDAQDQGRDAAGVP